MIYNFSFRTDSSAEILGLNHTAEDLASSVRDPETMGIAVLYNKTERRHIIDQSLHEAVRMDNIFLVESELEEGRDVNGKERNRGGSPLHLAAYGDYLNIAEKLISAGVIIDIPDNTESTPLHIAAGEGSANVVQCLLEHGADIERKGENELTPLGYAAYGQEGHTDEGHRKVVRILLEKGADPNNNGSDNVTALHYVVSRNDLETATLLLEHGANIYSPLASDGRTPNDFIDKSDPKPMAQLLAKYSPKKKWWKF